jgi:hypothetical protein
MIMKKIVYLFLVLSVSGFSYAFSPENFSGFELGMNRKSVEELVKKKNFSNIKDKNTSKDISYYEGKNIEVYGILFDNVKVIYDDNNRVKGLVFKLYISYEEGTHRRIFRTLHNEIKPDADSTADEGIRFNYLFRLKEQKGNTYVRISIKELLQGDSGYDIILTCGPTNARLNAN